MTCVSPIPKDQRNLWSPAQMNSPPFASRDHSRTDNSRCSTNCRAKFSTATVCSHASRVLHQLYMMQVRQLQECSGLVQWLWWGIRWDQGRYKKLNEEFTALNAEQGESWSNEWWHARGRRVVQTWLGDCKDPYMILRPQFLGLYWYETQCIACMLVYSYVCILLLCFVYYFNVNSIFLWNVCNILQFNIIIHSIYVFLHDSNWTLHMFHYTYYDSY